MHPFRLVSDDLHGCRRVPRCPPEVRTGRMPQIVKPKVGNPRPTACLVKGGLDVPNWLVFVQEDMLGVQSPFLPQLSEYPIHIWGHGHRARLPVFGVPKHKLPALHIDLWPFQTQ